MDTPYEKRPAKKKNSRDSDSFCKITVVQLLACAFMILLLAVVCRLSPDSGVAVKNKYDKLMSNSISLSEVWASAKEVAYHVFKPAPAKSVQSNVQVKTNAQSEEKTENTDNKQGTTTQQTTQAEPQSKISSDNTAAVMSFFSDDAEIVAPVHGKITSYFGSRTDPISGENGFHRAIDIAVDEGTSVAAAWDGIVTKTGYDSTRGNYLWMVHKNGCETFYCHCSKILVEKGAVIRAGESVALSGDTGYSTGPHLHFAVRKDGEMQDPLDYLTQKDGRI